MRSTADLLPVRGPYRLVEHESTCGFDLEMPARQPGTGKPKWGKTSHGNPVARQSEVILSRPVVEHGKVSVGHYVVGLRDVPAPPERVSQI